MMLQSHSVLIKQIEDVVETVNVIFFIDTGASASEQSAIALTVYREGEATRYTTPFGTTTPGSLEIEALDTVAGLASLSWSGTFEAYDELENPLGEVTVSGSVVAAPLEAGGN